MANVIVQQGDTRILDAIVADGTVLATLKLFQNNHTPAPTDTEANYTEATFSGYADIDISAQWGAAFVNGNGQGEIDCPPFTFAFGGGAVTNNVYGAYVVDGAGALIYAERFAAPVFMSAAPDEIIYTPKFTAVTA